MVKSKKEKKEARREREEQLKGLRQRIQDKLLLDTESAEEVIYTLAPSPLKEHDEESDLAAATKAPTTSDPLHSTTNTAAKVHTDQQVAKEEEEDRVVLPVMDGAGKSQEGGSALAGRKKHKMSWETLKLEAAAAFGSEATEVVGQHDGNTMDPLFTVRLKVEPHTVPVPTHWQLKRNFLSLQADREEACGIVPPEVAALGIEKIRATKDKKANPNQVAFIACFMTGTPLQHRTYNVDLTKPGDVFYEGKWRPKAHFTPGVFSSRLRQALGIAATAPPPWLYSLQAMRRLPPAYPELRIPGLNAPIPAGGQWGRGEGQWGEPPRGENNAFLFPGVRDEATSDMETIAVHWGTVPPLKQATFSDGASNAMPSAPVPRPQAAAAPPAAGSGGPTITPVIFQPQAYMSQQAMPAARVTPQEYVHVQDNTTNSTVAVGYVMMPKDGVQPQQQQPYGNARSAPSDGRR